MQKNYHTTVNSTRIYVRRKTLGLLLSILTECPAIVYGFHLLVLDFSLSLRVCRCASRVFVGGVRVVWEVGVGVENLHVHKLSLQLNTRFFT